MSKYRYKSHISYCCVPNCFNTSLTKPNLSFFSIPPTEERRNKWLRLLALEKMINQPRLSKSRKVCEDHFSLQAILYTNNRKILKKTAIPSRRLPMKNKAAEPSHLIHLASKFTQTGAKESIDIEEGNSSQRQTTANSLSDSENTQFAYTRRSQIIKKNQEDLVLFDQLCDTYLNKDLAQLIKTNRTLAFKSNTEPKQDYRRFCLNLYQTSPEVYDYLQKIFRLPTSKTLNRQFIKVDSDVNNNIMLALKKRVDKMTAKQKNCSVLIGSLRLKPHLCYNNKKDKIVGFQEINGVQSPEPATRALIVMIRGIFSNWKQPIGYALLSNSGNEDKINIWIDDILKSLIETGLNVRTIISSMEDDWINIVRQGLISIETPYFLVNNNKIYHVFNVPELMNSVRDTMFSHDLHFQNYIAKYEDILKFYNEDQKKKFPLARKLTKSHLNPTDTEKEQVRYAAELFSKTVANSICHYIDYNIIEVAEKGTVTFITKMNDLFDALNAFKRKHEDSEQKRAFLGDESQKKFFEEMLLFFQSLKVINSKTGQDDTTTVKFIQGFLITIKTINLLFDDFKAEGHNYLPTRNLHREALDIFLKGLISENGDRKKLTSQQFTSAYGKLFYSYLKKFTLQGHSSKEGLKTFFIQPDQLKEDNNIVKRRAQRDIPIPEPSNGGDDIKIVQADYTHIDTQEKHSLFYICKYLMNKTRDNHTNCQDFEYYVSLWNKGIDIKITEQYRQNNPESLLVVPCDHFVRFVEKMDEVFVESISSKRLSHKIFETTCKKIEEIIFLPPCVCFPTMYVIKLFTRIRIFYTIRANNTEFNKHRRKPKYFLVPKI